MIQYYKSTYFLNASHSFDNDRAHMHGHTFVITLYFFFKPNRKFVPYREIDRMVEGFLEPMHGRYLNEYDALGNPISTLESMGEVFYEQLKHALEREGAELIQLDISENPTKIYSVSERILLSSRFRADVRKNWDGILEQKRMLLSGKQD